MNELVVKSVDFYGAELLSVQCPEDNMIYVAINHILRGIGFTEEKAIEYLRGKMNNDIVISKGIRKFSGTLIGAGTGKEMLYISLKKLPYALAKINITPKMRQSNPEMVITLERYQEECADVLASHFIEHKTNISPIPSTDDYMTLIKHMEEREQRHYETMMSMFKSFESSMRNLAGILLTNTRVSVDTGKMIEESKSNYTNKGKQYRAEVIDLCQQIVAISDFEDEKAVLAACYKHLTKNYGIIWEQEIREWKEQHTWSGKVSALNVISESDDDKYLKSMLKNVLLQILDDCKKKGVTTASNSELDSEEVETTVSADDSTDKPNETRISTYVPAEDFDSACELVAQIAKQSGDKSPYNAVTFMRIYKSMDDYANICWDYHERKFRQNHKFPKSARVSKKCMINESSKLQKLFVAAVNKYMEEIENAK